MCWMDFHNTFLCCGFLCARLISLYFVSILCLSSRLPHRGLPRPILTTTGYHASVYIPVITPELPRSTTHVHRVITPAISNSYFVVYLSPAFTPPVLLHPTPPPGATRTNLLHNLIIVSRVRRRNMARSFDSAEGSTVSDSVRLVSMPTTRSSAVLGCRVRIGGRFEVFCEFDAS